MFSLPGWLTLPHNGRKEDVLALFLPGPEQQQSQPSVSGHVVRKMEPKGIQWHLGIARTKGKARSWQEQVWWKGQGMDKMRERDWDRERKGDKENSAESNRGWWPSGRCARLGSRISEFQSCHWFPDCVTLGKSYHFSLSLGYPSGNGDNTEPPPR